MSRKQRNQPRRRVAAKGANIVQPDPESRPVTGPAAMPADEERHRMIAEAAYFRAERRGFVPGNELEDWLQAEADVERVVQSGGSRSKNSIQVP